MSKVSVIVPVYNTSKQLPICLNSLVNQTFKDIEIVVINDGSNDQSEEIIKEYMIRYEGMFKYFCKKNEGISKTRNYGIKKSDSEYILFVDSDDYIEKDTIEKLMPYINKNVEIIKFKLQKVDENGKILEKIDGPIFDEKSGPDAFNELYSKDVLIDSPCLYVIKKELFENNNLEFQRKYHEDFGLIPLLIVNAKSFVSTPFYLYSYVQKQNSITRNVDYSKTIDRFEDTLFHYDNAIIKIENMKLDEITKENVKIYYSNVLILRLNELKKEDKKKYIKEIKKRKIYKNIQPRNIKQLIKRCLIKFNMNLYLKMR